MNTKEKKMPKFLSIHTLTSYTNTSFNHDESGESKTCMVGGVIRGRISSQCLKYHWQRSPLMVALDLQSNADKHHRTRKAFELIFESLKNEGFEEKKILESLSLLMLAFKSGKSSKSDDDEKTKKVEIAKSINNLLFPQNICISDIEINGLLDIARQGISDPKVFQSKFVLPKTSLPPSTALTGKFNTIKSLDTVDSALRVAHSFSIHSHSSDQDFYIASDDLEKDKGAAFLSSTDITSNTFYGCAIVELDQFSRNRESNINLLTNEISTFIEVVCRTTPSGKSSSTAPYQSAKFLLLELNDYPITLADAFRKALPNNANLMPVAYDQIISFLSNKDSDYGLSSNRAFFGSEMSNDQKEMFEQNLLCEKISIPTLSLWLGKYLNA